jgi:hypothetical protein
MKDAAGGALPAPVQKTRRDKNFSFYRAIS